MCQHGERRKCITRWQQTARSIRVMSLSWHCHQSPLSGFWLNSKFAYWWKIENYFGTSLKSTASFPVMFCELQRHTSLHSWSSEPLNECSFLFSCFPIWQKSDSFFWSSPKSFSLWNASHLPWIDIVACCVLRDGRYCFIVLWYLTPLEKNHSESPVMKLSWKGRKRY